MSEKQNEANRRNAQRSTGPVTAAGKVISARNAVKFGLWGREALSAGEDSEEFNAFRAGYVADLQPVGTVEQFHVEQFHVEQVVTSAWRLRRVRRLEAQVLAEQSFPEPEKAATPGRAFLTDCRGLNALSKLARDESRIERSNYRALHELQRLQAVRRRPSSTSSTGYGGRREPTRCRYGGVAVASACTRGSGRRGYLRGYGGGVVGDGREM